MIQFGKICRSISSLPPREIASIALRGPFRLGSAICYFADEKPAEHGPALGLYIFGDHSPLVCVEDIFPIKDGQNETAFSNEKWCGLCALVTLICTAMLPAQNWTVYATGLNNPRGLTFGPDGALCVSNVGFGPPPVGMGQVIRITVPPVTH
jgi:hypothetical protein